MSPRRPIHHDGTSERPTELEEPERVHVGQLRRLTLLVDDMLARWVSLETHAKLERRVAQLERWGGTRDLAALILLVATVTWAAVVTVAAAALVVALLYAP